MWCSSVISLTGGRSQGKREGVQMAAEILTRRQWMGDSLPTPLLPRCSSKEWTGCSTCSGKVRVIILLPDDKSIPPRAWRHVVFVFLGVIEGWKYRCNFSLLLLQEKDAEGLTFWSSPGKTGLVRGVVRQTALGEWCPVVPARPTFVQFLFLLGSENEASRNA